MRMAGLEVLVALVGSHHHHRARLPEATQGIQHVHRAHDVRRHRLGRNRIGQAHQRLCCEMEDKIRLAVGD